MISEHGAGSISLHLLLFCLVLSREGGDSGYENGYKDWTPRSLGTQCC